MTLSLAVKVAVCRAVAGPERRRPSSLPQAAQWGRFHIENDYLALASAPRMKKAVTATLEAGTPVGPAGRGSCVAIAKNSRGGSSSVLWGGGALFFPAGYLANLAA